MVYLGPAGDSAAEVALAPRGEIGQPWGIFPGTPLRGPPWLCPSHQPLREIKQPSGGESGLVPEGPGPEGWRTPGGPWGARTAGGRGIKTMMGQVWPLCPGQVSLGGTSLDAREVHLFIHSFILHVFIQHLTYALQACA